MNNLKRWRGLGALIGDAVEHGASAIERVHLATAERPFRIIEQIPGIAEPTKGVHAVHDAIVSGVSAQVRWVNRLVGKALDVTFDVLEDSEPTKPDG
jgi:hypothetical protein